MKYGELVTIIIPIYNCERFLDRCLRSIEGQTYNNLEIILVDDGSTDGSSKIYSKFKRECARNIRIILQSNQGVSAARNNGLKNAHGSYVTFVDGDDYVDSDYVEFLINEIADYNVELAICGYAFKSEQNKVLKESKKSRVIYNNSKDVVRDSFRTDMFQGFVCAKMFSMELIKTNNLLFHKNVNVYEDHLFFVQYLNFVSKAVYENKKLYSYMKHENSSIRKKASLSDMTAYKIMYNNSPEKIIDNKITEIRVRAYPFLDLNEKKCEKRKLKKSGIMFFLSKEVRTKIKLIMIVELILPINFFNYLRSRS